MKRVVLWLDDMRDPSSCSNRDLVNGFNPDEVVWVKSVDAFKEAFAEIQEDDSKTLVAVCFDNDLGEFGKEGRHAFTWMEKVVRAKNLDPFALYAQTANPAAKKELYAGFDALFSFWFEI
jgi:hypothetical protein